MTIKELEKQRNELDNKIRQYYQQEKLGKFDSNKKYIGKTFKQKNEDDSVSYYKIMHPVIDNEFRFATFIFTLPIQIDFSQTWSIDNELCGFDTVGVLCSRIKSDGSKSLEIESFDEISENEFNENLEEFFKSMKEVLNV
jgi:hypothetical protein